jgi:(p)ppGpp synthase/HD superfamily hydrolase
MMSDRVDAMAIGRARLDTHHEQLVIARTIAAMAHHGQMDRNAEPYIEHPRAVADAVDEPGEKIVAWLHDVMEDAPAIEREDLVRMGIDATLVASVFVLTRQRESYGAYIRRIIASADRRALVVKLADLRHNLRPGCSEDQRTRYIWAITALDAALSTLHHATRDGGTVETTRKDS